MADKKELIQLMGLRKKNLPKWIVGKIPHHYKRLSVDSETADRLAKMGQAELWAAFKVKLYYTQALIAGAMLSGLFDNFAMCTSSQYGKSWLLARIAIVKAWRGDTVYIAGARKDTTEIIMRHMLNALQTAAPEIQKALTETDSQIKRLAKSLSKTRISFHNGGSIESVTLGDTYSGLSQNSAIGRGGDYIVDEAALISDDTLSELGRVDFAKVNGEKCQLAMISNPHATGMFYDMLTESEDERTFVVWADALTAVEEERFDEETVLNGKFTKNKSTMRRYLLCVLESSGDSMFDDPKVVSEVPEGGMYFLGVDAAYKGKDNLCVALLKTVQNKYGKIDFYCEEIKVLDKSDWIDGVTNKQIIREITTIARRTGAMLTCVDQGWGVWLLHGLEDNYLNVKGIAFQGAPTSLRVKAKQYCATNAQNKRAEMHLDLQDLIENGKFYITEDAYDKIKDVLPFVLYDRTASGVVKIRDKKEIKKNIGRSPDELDALLLAVHAAILFSGESLAFAV